MEYTSSGKHYGINGADEFIKAILNDIALVKSPSTLIKYTFILIDLIIWGPYKGEIEALFIKKKPTPKT